MATSAERMRAHRERARGGIRRLPVDVNEDDFRMLAECGYEVPQAPTTISRRKQSACFSAMSFCKSDRTNPPSRTRNDTYPLGLQTRS
jgi:hypothetical protein